MYSNRIHFSDETHISLTATVAVHVGSSVAKSSHRETDPSCCYTK
jgi:hypothetical protein